ncbi:MAG: helicase, partial [Myxococcota bacterium]
MSASPDSLLTNTRFTDSAAAHLRAAIAAAGGIEVFAIGRLNPEGVVRDVEITCRGNDGAVPALLNRPRAGQVVIHNHPSGILKASDADMALASLYGENGVGVVIVDNDVRRALWVVEPYYKPLKPVSEDAVRHFFEERLPKVMPGYEPRAPQVEMALRVSRGLNAGHISIIEAGTGTGKSLAYLVPAVLWALKNDARVAVATFTINLQAQLVQSDIPILEKAGIAFRHATLKGRSNYICRRRMEEEAAREGGEPIVKTIAQWAETAQEGTRGDMAFPVEEESWDLIASDNDQTLRARCPHFNSCFYYQARRRAAAAHVVVVNHHLLLADLSVKKETGGEGILPAFDRLILDEGHHLEDVATSLFRQQLTARGLRRAITPLLTQRKKKQKKARMGALERIAGFHLDEDSPFPRDRRLDGLNLIQ